MPGSASVSSHDFKSLDALEPYFPMEISNKHIVVVQCMEYVHMRWQACKASARLDQTRHLTSQVRLGMELGLAAREVLATDGARHCRMATNID